MTMDPYATGSSLLCFLVQLKHGRWLKTGSRPYLLFVDRRSPYLFRFDCIPHSRLIYLRPNPPASRSSDPPPPPPRPIPFLATHLVPPSALVGSVACHLRCVLTCLGDTGRRQLIGCCFLGTFRSK